MKKIIIFGILALFLELTMFMSESLLVFPINAYNEPINIDNELESSQTSLKIIVSDQQAPAVMGVIDDFLADPLGSAVTNVEVVASGTRADDQHTYLIEQMILGSIEFDIIGLDTIWLAQFAENDWIIELDSKTWRR